MAAAAMASELEQGTELEEEPGHATAAPDFEQLGRRGPAGGGADPAAEIRPRAWRWEPDAMLLRRAHPPPCSSAAARPPPCRVRSRLASPLPRRARRRAPRAPPPRWWPELRQQQLSGEEKERTAEAKERERKMTGGAKGK